MHRNPFFKSISNVDKKILPVKNTYRSVFSIFISTSTLTEWDTFVATEDQAGVTGTTLHAGQVTGATGTCRVLTAGLLAGGATWGVVTARGAFQGWRGEQMNT